MATQSTVLHFSFSTPLCWGAPRGSLRRLANACRVWICGGLLAGALAAGGEDLAAQKVIGFRNDGSGYFPECAPPLEWSYVKNVLWVVPSPRGSNAQPIIVGERLFVLMGPMTLLCFDKHTGKELWRREAHAQDGVEEEKLAFQTERHLIWKTRVAENKRLLDPAKIEAELAEREKAARGIPKRYRGELEPRLERLRKEIAMAKQDVEGLKAEAGKLENDPAKDGLPSLGGLAAPLTGCGSTVPSPSSDGRQVFAFFPTGVLVSYDLDGQRRWLRFLLTEGLNRGNFPAGFWKTVGPATLVAENKVVVFHSNIVYALDTRTGQEKWKVCLSPGRINGTILKIGSPAYGCVNGTGYVAIPTGHIFQMSDGKEVARIEVGQCHYAVTVSPDRGGGNPNYPDVAVAGGHVFLGHEQGSFTVYQARLPFRCIGSNLAGPVSGVPLLFEGDRIYLRTQSVLYGLGHRVRGGPADDPKVIARIRASGETGVDFLIEQAGSNSTCYEYEACRALAVLGPKGAKAAGALLTLAEETDYRVLRAEALVALAAVAPAAYHKLMATALSPGGGKGRPPQGSWLDLRLGCYPECGRVLQPLLVGQDPALTGQVLKFMCETGTRTQDLLPVLQACLKSPAGGVRAETLRLLGALWTQQAIAPGPRGQALREELLQQLLPVCHSALQGSDPEVRLAAAGTFLRLGRDEEKMLALCQASAKDPGTARLACEELGWAAGTVSGALQQRSVETLGMVLRTHNVPEAKGGALRALAAYRGETGAILPDLDRMAAGKGENAEEALNAQEAILEGRVDQLGVRLGEPGAHGPALQELGAIARRGLGKTSRG